MIKYDKIKYITAIMVTVIVMAVLLYMKVREKIGRIRITHPAGFQTNLHILINCCTNGALTCNHFTEEPFDLFTHTVFVKVGEKDLFIREDWL